MKPMLGPPRRDLTSRDQTSDARRRVDPRRQRTPRWSIAAGDAWAAAPLALLVNALLLIWLLRAISPPLSSSEWQSSGIRIVWIVRTEAMPQKLPVLLPLRNARSPAATPANHVRTARRKSLRRASTRDLPQAPPLPVIAGSDRWDRVGARDRSAFEGIRFERRMLGIAPKDPTVAPPPMFTLQDASVMGRLSRMQQAGICRDCVRRWAVAPAWKSSSGRCGPTVAGSERPMPIVVYKTTSNSLPRRDPAYSAHHQPAIAYCGRGAHGATRVRWWRCGSRNRLSVFQRGR